MKRVGVLALQGDFEAHAHILRSTGAEPIEVRATSDLESCDALIIPGGESTTIGLLLEDHDLIEPIRKRVAGGMPLLGTCAGMIVCAKHVSDRALVRGAPQPLLELADITVRRNAFGRQVDSFETDLDVKGLDAPLHAVFIRAPVVEDAGPDVEIIAEYDGRPVAVRQDNLLLVAFHPEIAGDDRMHRLFVEGI